MGFSACQSPALWGFLGTPETTCRVPTPLVPISLRSLATILLCVRSAPCFIQVLWHCPDVHHRGVSVTSSLFSRVSQPRNPRAQGNGTVRRSLWFPPPASEGYQSCLPNRERFESRLAGCLVLAGAAGWAVSARPFGTDTASTREGRLGGRGKLNHSAGAGGRF